MVFGDKGLDEAAGKPPCTAWPGPVALRVVQTQEVVSAQGGHSLAWSREPRLFNLEPAYNQGGLAPDARAGTQTRPSQPGVGVGKKNPFPVS